MYPSLFKLSPQSCSSVLLSRPKGTGQTGWIIQTLPQAWMFNLLKADTCMSLLVNRTRIEQLIPSGFSGWIVIDEIPVLLNQVHHLIEVKGHRFLLTGSSTRKLRKEGANLLAGRAF